MRVTITMDKVDGSQSKAVDCDIEEIPTHQLRMYLSTVGVASITITRKDMLRELDKQKKRDKDMS